jgi:TrmH family RNA methyltransferase
MIEITSTANPRVKEIKSLANRKEREASGKAFIEGLRIAIEAIDAQVEVETLVYCEQLLTSQPGREALARFAQRQPEKVLSVSENVFRALSGKDGPQGLGAVIQQRWYQLNQVNLDSGQVILALDEPADPGNLGTILRTADSAGVETVILLDHSTDPYDPTAIRASMGAIFNIQLIRSTLMDFLSWKNQNGIYLAGAAGGEGVDYHVARYPEPMVLIMGSEREGLSAAHKAACDQLVSIPMYGRSDSLNLAMATGIILYEIVNQWRDIKEGKAIR